MDRLVTHNLSASATSWCTMCSGIGGSGLGWWLQALARAPNAKANRKVTETDGPVSLAYSMASLGQSAGLVGCGSSANGTNHSQYF
ncbi:hypothetical protein E2562_018645 [Oryza meyeriana var. granulata]|uniref:Uncharacterized protein n=1 Tax=Oryza meyeriana var. granulata TaxID=110450 RepID=A0A6G1BYA0_9ORYZ|nr:hypothetical protein E2562_018645 [Oryza meyeriana var. granulata]